MPININLSNKIDSDRFRRDIMNFSNSKKSTSNRGSVEYFAKKVEEIHKNFNLINEIKENNKETNSVKPHSSNKIKAQIDYYNSSVDKNITKIIGYRGRHISEYFLPNFRKKKIEIIITRLNFLRLKLQHELAIEKKGISTEAEINIIKFKPSFEVANDCIQLVCNSKIISKKSLNFIQNIVNDCLDLKMYYLIYEKKDISLNLDALKSHSSFDQFHEEIRSKIEYVDCNFYKHVNFFQFMVNSCDEENQSRVPQMIEKIVKYSSYLPTEKEILKFQKFQFKEENKSYFFSPERNSELSENELDKYFSQTPFILDNVFDTRIGITHEEYLSLSTKQLSQFMRLRSFYWAALTSKINAYASPLEDSDGEMKQDFAKEALLNFQEIRGRGDLFFPYKIFSLQEFKKFFPEEELNNVAVNYFLKCD